MSDPTTIAGAGQAGSLVRQPTDHGFGQVLTGQSGASRATTGAPTGAQGTTTNAPAGTLVGSRLVSQQTPGGTGTGTTPTPAGSTGATDATAGANDPAAALRALSVPRNDGIYEVADQAGTRPVSPRELASAIRASGANVALMGERHPGNGFGNVFKDNPNYWNTAVELQNQARADGKRVLLAVEQQASPDQQRLLERFNKNEIMEAEFSRDWIKAAEENHERIGGPEMPPGTWSGEARAITDARMHGFLVTYVDPGRWASGDREKAMAGAIRRESEAYGDDVITLARVGGAHAALGQVSTSGEKDIPGYERPIAQSNWENPAGRILNDRDDAGTLSIMVDSRGESSIANPNAPGAAANGLLNPMPHAWEFIIPGMTQ